MTVCVWVGYPNSDKSMAKDYGGKPVYGGTYPALIWRDYVVSAIATLNAEHTPHAPTQAVEHRRIGRRRRPGVGHDHRERGHGWRDDRPERSDGRHDRTVLDHRRQRRADRHAADAEQRCHQHPGRDHEPDGDRHAARGPAPGRGQGRGQAPAPARPRRRPARAVA